MTQDAEFSPDFVLILVTPPATKEVLVKVRDAFYGKLREDFTPAPTGIVSQTMSLHGSASNSPVGLRAFISFEKSYLPTEGTSDNEDVLLGRLRTAADLASVSVATTFPELCAPTPAGVSGKAPVDIRLARWQSWSVPKRLMVFDMDSCLMHGEVIDELAARNNAGEAVAAITKSAMSTALNYRASFLERIKFLKDLPESEMNDVWQKAEPNDGAIRLVHHLHHYKVKIALVSSGFTYYTSKVASALNFQYAFSNRLIADENGTLLGTAESPIVDGRMKAQIVRHIARREGWTHDNLAGAGDGSNDKHFLNNVSLPLAFHPKALLRSIIPTHLDTCTMEAMALSFPWEIENITSTPHVVLGAAESARPDFPTSIHDPKVRIPSLPPLAPVEAPRMDGPHRLIPLENLLLESMDIDHRLIPSPDPAKVRSLYSPVLSPAVEANEPRPTPPTTAPPLPNLN